MTDLLAVTVSVPYASLVEQGVKCVLDMDWSTDYSGRLLIRADDTWPRDDAAALAQWATVTTTNVLTLGAVVASCVLTDVLPIETPDSEIARGPRMVWTSGAGDLKIARYSPGVEADGHPWVTEADIESEIPFGDFSPGRYAWLLEDVKSTTERCPRCWGEGTVPWHEDREWRCGCGRGVRHAVDCGRRPPERVDCPTCVGFPGCAPVPMRGRQRLWTPTWEPA